MTRSLLASEVSEEAGVPIIAILTALSILATTLPQLIALCPQPEPEPLEVQVKRLCQHRQVIACKKIRETFPPKMRGKIKAARAICNRIAASSRADIRAMLEEANAA